MQSLQNQSSSHNVSNLTRKQGTFLLDNGAVVNSVKSVLIRQCVAMHMEQQLNFCITMALYANFTIHVAAESVILLCGVVLKIRTPHIFNLNNATGGTKYSRRKKRMRCVRYYNFIFFLKETNLNNHKSQMIKLSPLFKKIYTIFSLRTCIKIHKTHVRYFNCSYLS